MILYVARHGQTASNKQNVYAGRSGEGLSVAGVRQAEQLGQLVAGIGIGLVVTSPIERARITGRIVSDHVKCPMRVEPRLTEIKMGPWRGLSEAEVHERFPEQYSLWNTKPAELDVAGRETLADVKSRVDSYVQTLIDTNADKPIMLVSHVAVIRVMILHYSKRSLNDYKKIPVGNTDLHLFDLDEVARYMGPFGS